MRTYGRTPPDINGKRYWRVVTTTSNGYDDFVWITTLAQTLLLNLGESPFFANYGIPGHQSVMQQIYPDFYVAFTQQQFAKYFSILTVRRRATFKPIYDIVVVTRQGVTLNASVPIPT